MEKKYYWDQTSEIISKYLQRYFKEEMEICEIGFASGHFLEWLYSNGYKKLSGIEIRNDQYEATKREFLSKGLKINLMQGDAKKIQKKYDAVFSTGLIQCFDGDEQKDFLSNVSKIADIAIFTVPEIQQIRNENSISDVGVSGCKEFCTGNIPYILSLYYDVVKFEKLEKNEIQNCDNYYIYVCKK